MNFCLPVEFTSKFRQALTDGTINPDEMARMTSDKRRELLEPIVGKENAADVNAEFEKKLLLKNQQRGMITWAKNVAGLTEKAKTDLISRIERMDSAFTADNEDDFLKDLAAQKLGAGVSFDEAKQVTEHAKEANNARQNWNKDKYAADYAKDPRDKNAGWTNEEDRLDYGAKYVALQNYVSELKGSGQSFIERAKERGVEGTGQTIGDFVSTVGGIAKSVKASFDDSFIGRQGFKAMFTHPKQWAVSAANSFKLIADQLGHKASDSQVLDAVKADIYSRPNAMNGLYDKAKLDIGNTEEEFPTSAVESVPLLGRVFKASEVAFEGTAYRLRADIFDDYVSRAQKMGADLSKPSDVRSMGKLVNSLTGRGDLGPLEKVGKTVNNLFFSPKFFKSNLDFLTAHLFDDTSGFAKREAAINLARVVIGTGTILAIANAVAPGSVNFDPRSSDFGKIKVGDTRFDVTGGMGPIATLASRVIPTEHDGKFGFWSQSSTSGKYQELSTGKYGVSTAADVFNDFMWNRSAPVGSVLHDIWTQQDSNFQKPTIQGELENFSEPFVASNIQQMLSDPNSANWIAGEILDGLGFSQNTYAPTKKK